MTARGRKQQTYRDKFKVPLQQVTTFRQGILLDSTLQHFNHSKALLAIESDVPLVPILPRTPPANRIAGRLPSAIPAAMTIAEFHSLFG
jgi:hypothetical protein